MFLMFRMFRSLWERVTANVRYQAVHRPAAMAHLLGEADATTFPNKLDRQDNRRNELHTPDRVFR